MTEYTDEQLTLAVAAYNKERDRWRTRAHLPPRNGMPINAWTTAQQEASYDVLRENDDGELVDVALWQRDALHEPELFKRSTIAAMRAALAVLESL